MQLLGLYRTVTLSPPRFGKLVGGCWCTGLQAPKGTGLTATPGALCSWTLGPSVDSNPKSKQWRNTWIATESKDTKEQNLLRGLRVLAMHNFNNTIPVWCTNFAFIYVDLILAPSRNYPQRFGDAVLRLRDDLLENQTNSMKNLFRSQCYREPLPLGPEIMRMRDEAADHEGLFAFAGLPSIYKYARGCKYLNLPVHWKEMFPLTIPDPVSFNERMEQMEMETWKVWPTNSENSKQPSRTFEVSDRDLFGFAWNCSNEK